VLELGAGVGFTSLIADALGASDVTITDGNEDVLRLADENIRVNVGKPHQESVRTARLRWNTEDEAAFTQREKPWDYIFASDVTYLKKNRADLIASIYHLSGPKTVTYVSMEPRRAGEVEEILGLAEAQGLTWKEENLSIDTIKQGCGLLCERMFSFTKVPSTL
jgi:predicted nicotinamide N-methyase